MSQPVRRSTALRVAVPLVLALSGVLFVAGAQNAGGHDLRADNTDLGDVIRAQSRQVQQKGARAASLRDEIDRVSKDQGGAAAEGLQSTIDGLRGQVGLQAVHGPGVTVTLDDSKLIAAGAKPADGTNYDDYLIHQQDVEAVMNALWQGGAEAMTVMGQRIISTSGVRCVGNVVVVNGRTFYPPYDITALGDQDALRQSLRGSELMQNFLPWVDKVKLGYDVKTRKDVELAGYTGSTDLSYVEGVS